MYLSHDHLVSYIIYYELSADPSIQAKYLQPHSQLHYSNFAIKLGKKGLRKQLLLEYKVQSLNAV